LRANYRDRGVRIQEGADLLRRHVSPADHQTGTTCYPQKNRVVLHAAMLARTAAERISGRAIAHRRQRSATGDLLQPFHAENDDPQPQVRLAFGLTNLKPAPCRPWT